MTIMNESVMRLKHDILEVVYFAVKSIEGKRIIGYNIHLS